MKNKKAGTIGAGMIAPSVIILAVVIMAGFMVYATAASKLKQPPELEVTAFLTPQSSNVLFQPVTISLDGKETEVTLYNALQLRIENTISKEELKQSLEKLAKETGSCYYLSFYSEMTTIDLPGKSKIDTDLEVYNGQIIPKISLRKSKLVEINNKEYRLKHYFGRCE